MHEPKCDLKEIDFSFKMSTNLEIKTNEFYEACINAGVKFTEVVGGKPTAELNDKEKWTLETIRKLCGQASEWRMDAMIGGVVQRKVEDQV